MTGLDLPQENVDRLEIEGRIIYLVGTAHVSQRSTELAEEIIRKVVPDTVAVELCEARYRSLQDPDRWKNTDIVKVIREGKVYVLLAQLILAAFQKKLGNHLQVKPGAEMLRAVSVAKELNAEFVLADRDVKVTLKRTWAKLGFLSMGKVLFAMLSGLFTNEKIDAAEIERLKSADAFEELMRDFTAALPDVREALIDERDRYLATKIVTSPGKTVVAVIGAGHVPGIKNWISKPSDLAALEIIPKPAFWRTALTWTIPILVIGFIVYGFIGGGKEIGAAMVWQWVIINAFFGGLGALLALGHPLTVLSAALASPFTTLHPLLASGWIAGLVEASIRKPRVSDLESIGDDLGTFRGWWKNRLGRILLVICLTNLFGTIGALVGIGKIWSLR